MYPDRTGSGAPYLATCVKLIALQFDAQIAGNPSSGTICKRCALTPNSSTSWVKLIVFNWLLVSLCFGFCVGDGAGGSDGGVGLDAQHEPCGVLRRASARDVPRAGAGSEVCEPAFRRLQDHSCSASGSARSKYVAATLSTLSLSRNCTKFCTRNVLTFRFWRSCCSFWVRPIRNPFQLPLSP
jgi:hypothetical protein